jgi:putative tryptophan/tyrosine transport system substrate-binding protein
MNQRGGTIPCDGAISSQGSGSAAAWPIRARAQQASMPVIGVLTPSRSSQFLSAFLRNSLKAVGYVEGQNVQIEYRSEATNFERQREFAADLVRRQVAVILAYGLDPALSSPTKMRRRPERRPGARAVFLTGIPDT